MADAGSARVEIQPSANRFNAHLKSQEALLTCQEVSINYGTLTRWTQYVCRYVSVRYDVTFFWPMLGIGCPFLRSLQQYALATSLWLRDSKPAQFHVFDKGETSFSSSRSFSKGSRLNFEESNWQKSCFHSGYMSW